MKNLLKTEVEIKPITLFFIVSIAGLAVSFLISLTPYAGPVDWFDMGGSASRRFMDFFGHFGLSSKTQELYQYATGIWGLFPPINYIFYYPLFLMSGGQPGLIPDEVLATANFELIQSCAEYYMPVSSMTFMYYCVLVSFILFCVIRSIGKKNEAVNILLFLVLMLSAEFLWGAMQRGNAAMIVMVLLTAALHWKDSESRWKREAALLLIALCAAMKIYPAFFGLLYLKEKRWKEALRLTLYGLLLFFVPFAFFGGIGGMKLWFGYLMGTEDIFRLGRINYISGLVDTIAFYLSGGSVVTGLGTPTKLLTYLYLAVMLLLALFSRSKYRTIFFLCCAMIFFPINANRYTLAYLAVPLVFFVKEDPDDDPWVIMLLFGMLFSMPGMYGILRKWDMLGILFFGSTAMDEYLYCIAYLLGLAVAIREIVSLVRAKKDAAGDASAPPLQAEADA